MGKKAIGTGSIKELDLNLDSSQNPSIDYTDGGDFAISTHVADILKGTEQVKSMMNVLVFAANGSARVELNGKEYSLQPHEVIICPSHIIIGNYWMSEDFEAKAICLSNRLLYNILGDKIENWVRTVYIDKRIIHSLTEAELRRMDYYSVLSRSIMDDPDIPFRSDLLRTQIEAMMLELCGKITVSAEPHQELAPYPQMLFFRFLKSLTEASVKRRPVSVYAEELAITPKYLTYICNRFSGRTAMEWIDKFVMEDVRYYLKSTPYSIKEVGVRLGFNNNSFFGRYVVRHVGMSPIHYRRFLKK